ncbi:hypothetical protein OS493_006926 [Desmophyllum pertusum]|uniref:Uncharacterized protein n=1 Tax=Desmophyllum pertusum TaxID=174260 RepID=A0A9X0D4D7_9CNID|nr:hypothetical protein OS493_006926 [Desmophyllum pertusum]
MGGRNLTRTSLTRYSELTKQKQANKKMVSTHNILRKRFNGCIDTIEKLTAEKTSLEKKLKLQVAVVQHLKKEIDELNLQLKGTRGNSNMKQTAKGKICHTKPPKDSLESAKIYEANKALLTELRSQTPVSSKKNKPTASDESSSEDDESTVPSPSKKKKAADESASEDDESTVPSPSKKKKAATPVSSKINKPTAAKSHWMGLYASGGIQAYKHFLRRRATDESPEKKIVKSY